MVPFLAVFALWHPADNSSQPGSLRVPLAPAGLFVLCRALSRGEKPHFPPWFEFLHSAGLFVLLGKQQSHGKGDKGGECLFSVCSCWLHSHPSAG